MKVIWCNEKLRRSESPREELSDRPQHSYGLKYNLQPIKSRASVNQFRLILNLLVIDFCTKVERYICLRQLSIPAAIRFILFKVELFG